MTITMLQVDRIGCCHTIVRPPSGEPLIPRGLKKPQLKALRFIKLDSKERREFDVSSYLVQEKHAPPTTPCTEESMSRAIPVEASCVIMYPGDPYLRKMEHALRNLWSERGFPVPVWRTKECPSRTF